MSKFVLLVIDGSGRRVLASTGQPVTDIHRRRYRSAPSMADTQTLQPDTAVDDLLGDVRFVLDLDALMNLERQNPLSTGTRRERVAEHCWQVAIATIVLVKH